MTMTRSERHGHGSQKKGLRNFHEKLDLNKSSQLLQQQPDVQCQLLENQYHPEKKKRSVAGLAKDSQYGQVARSTDKHKGHFNEEAQLDGKLVAEANHVDVGVDPLLILAQAAEKVAESENSFSVMHTSHQNRGSNNVPVEQMYTMKISNASAVDKESSQEEHEEMPLDSHVSSQKSGFSYEVTRPRITQIRKQARTKYLFLDKENIEESQCSHLFLHRKPIRLTQIKHQARCKGKNNLLTQEMIIENSNEQPQERLVGMSQVKHLAWCNGKSTAEEGTGNYKDGHLHCKQFEDNKREGVVECKLTKEAICPPDNQIGVASVKAQKNTQPVDFNLPAVKSVPANSLFSGLSQSSVENPQGHVSSNESSRITYECHQHVPNTLPMQNNVLNSSFTNSANKIFLHSETNMGRLSHMHNLQLKDYDRILARQRRAERIEKKRASKGKHQSSNSPGQPEAASGGELHCTQLKEDYRCSVARQRRAELMKRKRASKDKHQCSENPLQQITASGIDLHCTQLKESHGSQQFSPSSHTEANCDKQKEFLSVKGKTRISQMSISQLRREARLRSQCHARS